MYLQIDLTLSDQLNLAEITVLALIKFRCNGSGVCQQSKASMARDLPVSRSKIFEALERLESLGFISREGHMIWVNSPESGPLPAQNSPGSGPFRISNSPGSGPGSPESGPKKSRIRTKIVQNLDTKESIKESSKVTIKEVDAGARDELQDLMEFLYQSWPNEKKIEPILLIRQTDPEILKLLRENCGKIRQAFEAVKGKIGKRQALKFWLTRGDWQTVDLAAATRPSARDQFVFGK